MDEQKRGKELKRRLEETIRQTQQEMRRNKEAKILATKILYGLSRDKIEKSKKL